MLVGRASTVVFYIPLSDGLGVANYSAGGMLCLVNLAHYVGREIDIKALVGDRAVDFRASRTQSDTMPSDSVDAPATRVSVGVVDASATTIPFGFNRSGPLLCTTVGSLEGI